MAYTTMQGPNPPITFSNAPTFESEGRRYLTDEAAEVLGDQLADRYTDLLGRLAEE